VVLAEAEHVEPDLVGEGDLLQQFRDPLDRTHPCTNCDVRERERADLHGVPLVVPGGCLLGGRRRRLSGASPKYSR